MPGKHKRGAIRRAADYLLKNYKTGMVLSFAILLVFLSILLVNFFQTGQIVERDFDFIGGTRADVLLAQEVDVEIVQKELSGTISNVRVRLAENHLLIESAQQFEEKNVRSFLEDVGISFTEISIYSIGPALSEAFWVQAQQAIVVAFVVMAVVLFFAFKTVVPALAVILAALSDWAAALALMNIFGIPLSLATLAALLLIIGYSVDTDILLSTRVLKRKALPLLERITSSIKTGMTMSVTSIIALAVLYIVAAPSLTLRQIAAVIIFGLSADLVFTWLQNAGILRWYVEKREGARG